MCPVILYSLEFKESDSRKDKDKIKMIKIPGQEKERCQLKSMLFLHPCAIIHLRSHLIRENCDKDMNILDWDSLKYKTSVK